MAVTYRVRLAFMGGPGNADDMPTVIEACDEYTEDAWNGIPDFFQEALDKDPVNVRQIIVEIPQSAVKALFEVPVVQGEVR